MVLSESGDDEIVNCPACGYASNQEVADSKIEQAGGERSELQKVHTPDMRTIEEVSGFLGVDSSKLVKSLVYAVGKKFVFVLVRGDHQVDEGKLEAALGECRPAEPDEVRKLTGAGVGFVSPVGVEGAEVIADPVLEGTTDLVAGANEDHYHLTGVDMERDIHVDRYVSLRTVQTGEPCVNCGRPLEVSRAIEVGHIFKLGEALFRSPGRRVPRRERRYRDSYHGIVRYRRGTHHGVCGREEFRRYAHGLATGDRAFSGSDTAVERDERRCPNGGRKSL